MCCDSKCVPEGPRGLSAYEIWLAEGNTGTEQDFLDSLVGATGAAGANGADGPQGEAGVCDCEIVHSGVERAPVVSAEVSTILTGTSYTVPALGAGDYRVLYTGHVDFTTGAGSLNLYIMKNGVEINSDYRRLITVGSTGFILSFNLFATEIPLIVGDVLSINGLSTNSDIAIRNCVIEISKV